MASHPFKSILYPYSNYFVLIFLVLVLIGMCFNDSTRLSLMVGGVFCIAVMVAYYALGIHKRVESVANEESELETE